MLSCVSGVVVDDDGVHGMCVVGVSAVGMAVVIVGCSVVGGCRWGYVAGVLPVLVLVVLAMISVVALLLVLMVVSAMLM